MTETLQQLAKKKGTLEAELSHIEKQVCMLQAVLKLTLSLLILNRSLLQLYEKEGHYLGAEHSQHGNVSKVLLALQL